MKLVRKKTYDFFGEKHTDYRIGGYIFYLVITNGLFWFRFFLGYGLHGRKAKTRGFTLFSERMGITKTVKLFGWTFKILKP